MKFPHSTYAKGKRVYVKLSDGSRIVGRFVEKRSKHILLDVGKILNRDIVGMGYQNGHAKI